MGYSVADSNKLEHGWSIGRPCFNFLPSAVDTEGPEISLLQCTWSQGGAGLLTLRVQVTT